MKNTCKIGVASLFFLLLGSFSITAAADTPSSDDQPLSAILKSVASARSGTIIEAELEDDAWEVKTCDSDECSKVYVDPRTAQIKSSKKTDHSEVPAKDLQSIISVVQNLEEKELGKIKEIEFEHGRWEVKLLIEPETKADKDEKENKEDQEDQADEED